MQQGKFSVRVWRLFHFVGETCFAAEVCFTAEVHFTVKTCFASRQRFALQCRGQFISLWRLFRFAVTVEVILLRCGGSFCCGELLCKCGIMKSAHALLGFRSFCCFALISTSRTYAWSHTPWHNSFIRLHRFRLYTSYTTSGITYTYYADTFDF